MKPLLLLLGGFGFLVWSASLFLRQAVRWAGGHPVGVALAALVVLPLAVVVVRGLPSRRELRRAVREGMAEVDAAAAREPAGPAPAAVAEEEPAVPEPVALDALSADAFEQAVARLCERDGCTDVRVVGGAGDLGADVVARTPDGRRLVVQCKRYAEDHKVGSQDLQRFGGTCYAVHAADVAVLVTTSTFTEPACEYAGTTGILCWDGDLLAAWCDGNGPAPWLGQDAAEPAVATPAPAPLLTPVPET